MWGWGHDWGWGWMLMSLAMIAFWTLGIAAVAWLTRGFGAPNRHEQAPLQTLEDRYARGEIDRDEFEERRRVLLGR